MPVRRRQLTPRTLSLFARAGRSFFATLLCSPRLPHPHDVPAVLNHVGGRALHQVGCWSRPERHRGVHMSDATRAVIRFYSTKGDYGCFSNFYRASIFLAGKRWSTTEHYFQAQKFAGTEHEE